MIAIIDYGVGNLKNVYTALKKLDLDAFITSDINKINNSHAIILPGVGAFKDAMDNLIDYNLVDCIKDNVKTGKPLLGICLGMQLLFDTSYEDGIWNGLGLIEGEIVRFSNNLKVPHMGWNSLHKNKDHKLIKDINEGEYVYFVHSYYLKARNFNNVLLYTDYDVKVPAVVAKDNVFGMQFHPEKSSDTGIKLLQNFKEMIKC
ncbi:MAG: imidazole glycerol phosphate synthase subunit HisH [Eubacteriaceae bacterium]